MAALYFVVVAALCLTAHALPDTPRLRMVSNTIFNDERLEGEVFENVDAFNDIVLYSSRNSNPYRLPTVTMPHHYNVLWTVEFPERQLSGVVDIQLYATQAQVNEITLQIEDLEITSLKLYQGEEVGQNEVELRDYYLVPEYHFLKVRILNGVLNYNADEKQIYTLSIAFKDSLRTDMYGIYESWYRDQPTGPEIWMATTQFQPVSARSAFPCYDEPSFKATFNVTIRRPSNYKSWFCTLRRDFANSVGKPNYVDDIYHTTPKMSTYLLALIVAQYESHPSNEINPELFEVIARPSAINANQGEYAYEIGKKLLAEMSSQTDYDFYSQHEHLKMTQAAIPDFGAGAMENWGLLTYREAYLLYDPVHTSSFYKQVIAYILSHEIAHMWFGNLVTCDWWDVLWLNEGFARYYQYFLTDAVDKELGFQIRFINEQMHTALLTDSANNPQPLSNPGVGSPASVNAMFSTISYNKGAAIIRMTEHLLGTEVNKQGLRNYLKQKQFDTAQPIHLFQALQNAAVAAGAISAYGPNFSVIDYYKSWTEQPGHPVLNVQVDHKTGTMTIYQRRFNINSGYSTAASNWYVPITFATASNPDFDNTKPSHVLSEAITVVDRGSVGDEWVIFNKQQTGFYRVNYDDYTWDLIIQALRGPQRTVINDQNRAQIVNDVFQFARSGIMSYNRAFNILSFMKEETSYTPWLAAVTGFNWIRNRIVGTSQQEPLENILRGWLEKVMADLKYEPASGESFMRSYLRYQLAPVACNLNVEDCRDAAVQQFQALQNGVEVPVDNRNWVYCNALRELGQPAFNFLWNRFKDHNVYTEKILLLQVLGCTNQQQALFSVLDAMVEEQYVIRPQDYTTALNSLVSGNEENTQIVFQYIQQKLDKVTETFGSPVTPLSYVSARLRTIEQVQAFEKWADDNRAALGNAYQSVRNGAANSRAALNWYENVKADIQDYLNNGDQEAETTTALPASSESPVTLPSSSLAPPVTPELPEPDSANTAMLSAALLSLAFIAHLAL